MNFLYVFLISFTHGLVATLEILNISHMRRFWSGFWCFWNSGFNFTLIYFVVVYEEFWLIVPWIAGDMLAVQVGIRWFGREK